MDTGKLRQDVANLGHSLRDLWTEHLGHYHPPEDR